MHRKISAITLTTIVFVSFALMLTAYAAVTVTATINSSGSIATSSNLGLYSDSSCTISITNLDWGSLTPGGTVTRTIYIKNTQGAASLTLNMAATNWNPTTANGPLTLTWNRQGTTLAPGQSTAATITLAVSPSATSITSFNVQIAITATG